MTGRPLASQLPKVVIDKPEDVLGVDHVVLIVEVLDAPIENEIGREALRIFGIESVNRARTLVDEVSSTGDPVIPAIGPVALNRVSGYGRAMLVPAELGGTGGPQDDAELALADVERQIPDQDALVSSMPERILLHPSLRRSHLGSCAAGPPFLVHVSNPIAPTLTQLCTFVQGQRPAGAGQSL